MLDPDSPEWGAALVRLRHDTYHRPEYVEFLARREGAEGVAAWLEEEGEALLVPLLLRGLPEEGPDGRDAISPYGYPGPLFSTEDPAARSRLWRRFVDLLAERGVVSAFVRSHPLLSPAFEGEWEGTLPVDHGRVVFVDLTEDLAAIEEQRRKVLRRDVAAIRDAGYSVILDDWDRYDRFIAMYRETMERVGASDFYFFGDEYFDGLKRGLGDDLHLCIVAAPDGETAAGGLFLHTAGLYQYHLGATAGTHRSDSPGKLMFDAMIRWTRSQGGTHLQLGGGVGGEEDSLFHFKAGWSNHTARYQTLRIVPDEGRYAKALAGAGVADDDRGGHFPGYRRGAS